MERTAKRIADCLKEDDLHWPLRILADEIDRLRGELSDHTQKLFIEVTCRIDRLGERIEKLKQGGKEQAALAAGELGEALRECNAEKEQLRAEVDRLGMKVQGMNADRASLLRQIDEYRAEIRELQNRRKSGRRK